MKLRDCAYWQVAEKRLRFLSYKFKILFNFLVFFFFFFFFVIALEVLLLLLLLLFGCTVSSLLHGLFSSCGEQGPLSSDKHGLLIAVASLVAKLGL